ncbi:MAG: hypothetical protein Q8T11_05575 [Elusimicrobiota bacterium]|nr:hypothetical protein [Elusimicrobiota bacterium]
MKNTRRVLAVFLAFLTLAFAPGLVSYEAAAQVINGAGSARAGGVPVVPTYGANGAGIAPLSPAASLAPGLVGGLSAPAFNAPAPTLSPVFAPAALTPGAARAVAAAIPSLPASAVAAQALGPSLTANGRGTSSPYGSVAAQSEAAAAPAADAKGQLALAGERLSAAADGDKTGLLDSFFTGARAIYGRLTGGNTASGSMVAQPSASAVVNEVPAAKSVVESPKATQPTPVALVGTGLQPGDKFLTAPAAEEKPQVPAPAPEAVDPAVGAKAIKWMYIQDAISMSVFIMTSIAYPMIVIPAVGTVTFGVLMALGPLAAIALGPLSGMIATRFAPREGLAILSGLRALLTVALPIMALTGMISFWPLLLASIANGWQFSLLMTSRSAYTRRFAITDPKQTRSWLHIGNLTTIGFSIYFLLQVMLGSIGQIGGLIDAMNPMTPFWISAAVNVGLVFLNYWKIPKIANIVSNAAGAVKAAAEPFTKKAAAFGKKFWKEIALFSGTIAVYAWGLPFVLPVIGTGIGSPLWMAAALLFWISRTETFKKVMSTPKIRNALLLSALAAGLIYPFQNLAMPLIAASLGAKALIFGQLLGAFFFGQLLSNASMARLPEVKIPFTSKTIAAERLLQAGVLTLAAIWAGVRLFPGSLLAAAAAVAIGAAIIAVTSRLTHRGWIKFYGIGLMAAVGVALSWGFFPGIFASVMLLGLFVGPFVSAITSYISGNSDPKMVSQTFGVSSSLFNALTSFGYGLMAASTKAYGDPAFPSALTPIIAVYVAAAILFFFAPRWLPGLPEKSLRSPEPKKPAA